MLEMSLLQPQTPGMVVLGMLDAWMSSLTYPKQLLPSCSCKHCFCQHKGTSHCLRQGVSLGAQSSMDLDHCVISVPCPAGAVGTRDSTLYDEYGSQDFVGAIDDLRIWRTARSGDQIVQVRIPILPVAGFCTPKAAAHCADARAIALPC